MKKLMTWALIHALHWAVLYGAFVLGSEGALHVLKFMVWLCAAFSLLLLANDEIERAAAKPREPVRLMLTNLQSWATLLALVWFGHIVTALAWGLAMAMFAAHWHEVREAREAAMYPEGQNPRPDGRWDNP